MFTSISKYWNSFFNQPSIIKDVCWFLFLFITLNLLWRFFVNEGVDEDQFIVIGRDLTSMVQPIMDWTTSAIYWVIHDLLGYENYVRIGNIVYFNTPEYFHGQSFDPFRLKIVWGCTAVKQIIIFTLLIMLFFGPWKKKLMFIPVSILILNAINILRIIATAFIVKDGFPDWFISFNEWKNDSIWISVSESYTWFRYDWFQLFHRDIFRWLYYDGVMFLLWLFWQEKINLPFRRKNKLETDSTTEKK